MVNWPLENYSEVMSEIEIVHSLNRSWIVSKPVGLSVHNDPDRDLISIFRQQLQLSQDPLPVNRLDKETSGLMVLAADSEAAKQMSGILAQSSAKKYYRAILRGQVKLQPQQHDKINQWSWPISDKAEGRQNPQGKSADRIAAVTNYEVLQSNKYLTEVMCKIETGRQHQIRKHAAIAKHAIVLDSRYGDAKFNKMIQEKYNVSRMMLHSEIMILNVSGKELEFMAPAPKEFQMFFA